MSRYVTLLLFIGLAFLGCATVHQPIGMDSNKTNKFSIGELNKYRTDDSKTKFYFQLSLEQAFDIITSTCFDLDIPLYYPLKDDSQKIYGGIQTWKRLGIRSNWIQLEL